MPEPFSSEALKQAATAGQIDTVIIAFVDMAGQLVGKRFHAAHFIESGHAETHACNYLLANDIEMEVGCRLCGGELESRIRRFRRET
jgi:glutamine synthetase